MSKTVDVDLRVRAKNLASKTLNEINADLDKLEKTQARQAKTSELAAASTKDLVEQQQALGAATRELSRRRDLIRSFEDQQKEIGQTAAKLRELAAAYAQMKKGAGGGAIGFSDKDVRRVGKEVVQTQASLQKLIERAKQTRSALNELGVDTSQLSQYINQLDSAVDRSANAYKASTVAIEKQGQAISHNNAIVAEATRRANDERAAINRAVKASNDQAVAQANLAQKRRDGLAALGGSNAAAERESAIRSRLVKFLNTERGARILNLEATRRGTSETNQNTNALNRNAGAAGKAGNALSQLGDKGRKSLNVYQRLRGQVLGLASAYIGVFQAINTFQKSIEATTRNQALKLGLQAVNKGDAKAAASDYEFLRKEADRLGFVFDDLAPKFQGLAAAGKALGLSNALLRRTFTDVATNVVGMNLSVDDAEGVFKAMVQIFSKARVQAEELRGQLGDRLPGAVVAFAKANDIALTDLDKKLKAGELGVAEIIKFINENAKQFTKPIEDGVVSLQQNINRAKNAYNDFLRSLLAGSNDTKLQTALKALTAFFKGEDGKKFASDLAFAFGALIEAFIFLAKHANTVFMILKALLALQVAKMFFGVAGSVGGAAIGMLKFYRNTTLLFAAIRGGMPVMTALMAALGVGIPSSAAAAGTAVTGLISGPIAALLAIAAAGIIIPIIIQYREDKKVAQVTQNVDSFLLKTKTSLDDSTRALSVAQSPETLRESIAAGEKAVKQLDLQVKKVKEVIALNDKARKAITNRGANNQEARAAARGFPQGGRASDIKAGTAQEDAKTQRQQDLIVGLEAQAALVRKQIGDAKLRLTNQEAAEAKRMDAELKRLASVGSKGDKDKKDKAKTAEQLEAELNRRLNAERAIQKEILDLDTATLQARMDGEATTTAQIEANFQLRLRQIANDIQEKRLQIEKLAQDAKTTGADASGIGAASAKLDELEKTLILRAQEDKLIEGIRLKQTELNRLQSEQNAEIEAINTLVELGIMSEVEGRAKVLEIQKQYRAEIVGSIEALKAALTALPPDLFARLGAKELITQLDSAIVKANAIKTEFQLIGEKLGGEFATGVASAFGTLAKGIAGLIQGTNSLGDAFKGALDSFLNFAADFLVKIGEMIIQAIILRAIQNALNGTSGGYFQAAVGALTGHTGGSVKSSGIGRGNPVRRVNPLVFAGASRFHEGGLPGLKANEVPAILKKREEVLTEDDPRNVLNGGGMGAGRSIDLTVHNHMDSGQVVKAGLKSNGAKTELRNVIASDVPFYKKIFGIG